MKIMTSLGREHLSGVARRAFIASLLMIASTQALAAKDALEIKLSQFVVTMQNGKEVRLDAGSSAPGDLLEYRAVYTNTDKRTIKKIVATLPLPEGLEYVKDSAYPVNPQAQASTGDGKFAPEPLLRVVPGYQQAEPVPYSEYRSLRWQFESLGAGKSIEIRARVRVVSLSVTGESNRGQALLAHVE